MGTTDEQPGEHRPAVRAAVELVAAGAVLPAPLAEAAMDELMDGSAPPAQVAALLAMLRVRGETPEELAAFARVMRARAVRVSAPDGAVDLCGTGADGADTFNISTLAAFVVAGAGVPVAKHGNRAVTSRCGSADVIEALGIPLDPGPEAVARRIGEIGFGFIFAPAYHPAMKHAMPIRRELPIRTSFNLLGPISSPAGVRRQLLGVAEERLLPLIAGALSRLDTDRALVVHSGDGLDELSLAGPNRAILVEGRHVGELVIDPGALGLRRASPRRAGRRRRAAQQRHRAQSSSAASRAPRATSSCSTPARRCSSPAAPPTSARASSMAAEAIDSGARRRGRRRLGTSRGRVARMSPSSTRFSPIARASPRRRVTPLARAAPRRSAAMPRRAALRGRAARRHRVSVDRRGRSAPRRRRLLREPGAGPAAVATSRARYAAAGGRRLRSSPSRPASAAVTTTSWPRRACGLPVAAQGLHRRPVRGLAGAGARCRMRSC